MTTYKDHKHIPIDRVEPTQRTNQGSNALENVDALKSQTVELHSHPGGADSAHSTKYQLRTHIDPNKHKLRSQLVD